jgi:hypothetical protein
MTEAAHEPHQSIIYGTALNRSSRPAWLKATAASGTRLGPFSQGRISKKIPQGLAVTPYFEVPARHREHELAQARRAGTSKYGFTAHSHSRCGLEKRGGKIAC